MEKPSTMESAAPSAAPEETPRVLPSAKGFRSRPCIAAPHRDSAAPMSPAHSTRGTRRESTMALYMPSGASRPSMAPSSSDRVSPRGTATLPRHTHSKNTADSNAVSRQDATIFRAVFMLYLRIGGGRPEKASTPGIGYAAGTAVSSAVTSVSSISATSVSRGPGRATALVGS